MKKIILFALIFALSLSNASFAQKSRGLKVKFLTPSGQRVSNTQWLFIIGINNYKKWPKLRTAVSDAKELKKVLLKRYYFDEKSTISLFDKQATRKNIIGKLEYLAKKVRKGDSLVVFYAGHGYINPITKVGSWVPVESELNNSASWIPNDTIKNYLRVDAIKAKHILLISDSCFSGDFFKGKRGKLPKVTNKLIRKAYEKTSRQAISSGGLEPVSDEGFGRNSVFSHFLINGLRDNNKNFLIPSDLFPYIKSGVYENAEQTPQLGSLSRTGGQRGGELVFFLRQDNRLKDLSKKSSYRSRELLKLQKIERESRLAKEKDERDIKSQEIKIKTLDAKIRAMKKRMGQDSDDEDSLKSILAMIKRKKLQKKELEDLKIKRRIEGARRKKEIERIKKKRRKNIKKFILKDVKDYKEILKSEYGKEFKEKAWKSLTSKYPEQAKGVLKYDLDAFLNGVNIRIETLPDYADILFTEYNERYSLDTKLKIGKSYKAIISSRGYYKKIVNIKFKNKRPIGIRLTRKFRPDKKKGFTNSAGMKFVYIESGDFEMGNTEGFFLERVGKSVFDGIAETVGGKKDNRKTEALHNVIISKGFYIQIAEVTQEMWKRVMGSNPAKFKDYGKNFPVEQVSWRDTQKFIKQLNKIEGGKHYRLPTESEWEYACRAGLKAKSIYGKRKYMKHVWFKVNSKNRTHRVGTRKPNKWKLYDMQGNVMEWVSDWKGDYPENSVTDPTGPKKGYTKVLRGGSFRHGSKHCQCSSRDALGTSSRFDYIGFRIVWMEKSRK
ncbi:MAG: SUMF1/EgtB/PvdO family nonheme iron enzyme [Desulfobacterales bacterium]|nr:SUMF1/EgtB/PvdO family nonheme iron enzyme [Desulfobacterales bacterium]MCP4158713.1 SUMF1/EgtB/PvdO family nonheme iron enzyme [Deltaproteobacteria bacterium]